jgi:hypothetical protein
MLLLSHEQGRTNNAKGTVFSAAATTTIVKGNIGNAEAPLLLPSCTLLLLSSPHKRGMTNNAKALSSAPRPLSLLMSHEQGT